MDKKERSSRNRGFHKVSSSSSYSNPINNSFHIRCNSNEQRRHHSPVESSYIKKMSSVSVMLIVVIASLCLINPSNAAGSGEVGRSKFGLYIVRSPESTIAPIGDEVVLECGVSVNPERIVWRFLPQNASKAHRRNFKIIDSDSADYKISLNDRSSSLGIIVSASTVGEYQCIAWYGASALASGVGQLILASVSLPGTAREQVERFSVSPGNTIVLNCGEIISNPPAVWKYLRNNSLIRTVDQVADNGMIVLSNVREGDSGLYSCSAMNSITSQTVNMPTRTELVVGATPKGPPRFLTPLAEVIKTRLGKTVMLLCPGVGNPVPKIIWSRDRGHLTGERVRILGYGLEISRVEMGDQGNYHCSVDNGIGPQLRHSVSLRVLEPPQIIKGPPSTLTNESHDLMMDCVAIGNPYPTVSWYINGENVAWDPKIRVTGENVYIESVQKTHAGMIQCFAKNEAGEVNEANLLQVNPKQIYSGSAPLGSVPDSMKLSFDHEAKEKKKNKHRKFSEIIMIPPSRPNVTRLSDESVMVRWSVSAGEGLPIQFFKVQYRMVGNANNSIPRGQWMTSSEDIPPHVRSYEVKELKPDHFYRFRIAAVYSNNDNKFGAISGKFHLQRASQLSPAKSHLVGPILQRVEGVSETEIRFVWSLPNHVGSPIEGFYAYFRPASTAGEYSKATIDGMDTREFTLNHLEPGTSYEFKLQSFTASAASDFSAILTGKTISPPVQRPPEESEVVEETKPPTQPNYIVIVAVSVLGMILLSIVGFCVCKKCRQTRDDATESKTHPADIPIAENNGFAGIPNALHKNNHNRSINITSNPLAAESDKNRNVMELRFLPNANNNSTNHSVGLVPPHPMPNNHAPNNVIYNSQHMHNNNLHFVDGLPRRTLERGLPRNALGGSGNMGGGSIGVPTMNIGIPVSHGPTIVNDIHNQNSSLRMPPGRRNSGSNNIPVPSSPRMIRNGISAELLHQHRSPLPKRAASGGGTNNLKRNGIRNEPITSGSIEV